MKQYFLYVLRSPFSTHFYIGMSVNTKRRMILHKSSARSNKTTKLYCWFRKYFESVVLEVLATYDNSEECQKAEKFLIALGRNLSQELLNIADGGEGGYVIPEWCRELWIEKLKLARRGRKPALGMKHTDEVKSLCKEASVQYWNTQSTYSEEVLTLPFCQAHLRYGISKTHYYRLRKRALSSEEC